MPLIRSVYVSAATKPFSPPQLRELLLKARAFNSSHGISGLLLYHQQSFFQILEGRANEVSSLFDRIEVDKRHHRVLLLSKGSVPHRNFGDWSMGFVDTELTPEKLPGFKKLMRAKSSFLELQGDSKLVARLIDGFHEGQWRQVIDQ